MTKLKKIIVRDNPDDPDTIKVFKAVIKEKNSLLSRFEIMYIIDHIDEYKKKYLNN